MLVLLPQFFLLLEVLLLEVGFGELDSRQLFLPPIFAVVGFGGFGTEVADLVNVVVL